MRKSLAPSQLSKKTICEDGIGIQKSSKQDHEKGMITIRRMPLFDFLEIPAALSEIQYKVPSGCIITKKSVYYFIIACFFNSMLFLYNVLLEILNCEK